MEIPSFDCNGVLPEGIYKVAVEDIKEKFCSIDNIETRNSLFNTFFKYLQCLKKHDVKFEVYLDGSFVTNKEVPNDIDIFLMYDLDYYNQDWSILIHDDYVRVKFKGLQVFPAFLETFSEDQTIDFAQNISNTPGKRKGIIKVLL